MTRALAVALLLIIPASLTAQHMGSAHFRGGSSTFSATHFGHAGHFRQSYYPLGLFDPLYDDYLSTGYPVASQPPVIIMQAPPTAASADPPPVPAQPLMIELQGDRYVQVSGDRSSRAQMIDRVPDSQSTRLVVPSHAQQSASPAVLVFRDGHREEVSAYTIADGVLYAAADYATTGAWNRKVELSSLNVPETIATNSSHGLRFQLPSAPNEVIVGP